MVSLMRAVHYTAPGFIDNLHTIMKHVPQLRDNECLVKVYYSAINRADTLQRRGLYPPPPNESETLGLEAAGIVQESNDSKWKTNDRVMALLGGGGNAEFVAVNANLLIKIPDTMSFKEASAIPETWLTAFQLLYWISSITKSDNFSKDVKDTKFLVHAGASGVGTALIQLLKNVLEVKNVFATVGSEEKKSFLENNLQVTRAFNYKTDSNLVGQLMEITGNTGVDVVFDCVGGTYWQTNLDSLRMDGELILYGLLGGGTVNGDILTKILRKRIHLKASTLRNRSLEYKKQLINDFDSKIMKHFESGKLKPIIDQVYDLEEIALAHHRMESNLNIGKILLKVFDEDNTNIEL